jgi:DNA-binding NarL/FixJ family response regulator
MSKNLLRTDGGTTHLSLRILAVDDHAAVLTGLRDVLGETYHVEAARSAIDAIECIMGGRYDIVLLDYYIGPITCVRVAEICRTRFPETKICVLTQFVNEEVMGSLAHVHPEAVLDKSITATDLRSTLERVARGETIYSPEAVEMLMRLAARSAVRPGTSKMPLSDIEQRILELFARGMTTSEIASHLSVSTSFVVFVRRDLKQRFRVRSVAQLVTTWEMMQHVP